jgi:hypothetical protein
MNEILELSISYKTIPLPRLPATAPEFSIAHISDLHLTGQMQPAFYEFVFEQVLKMGADLIVVTGDIVEKRRCLSWIESLFPALRAPLGTYFVLGNHELKIRDEQRIRQTITSAGWIDVAGKVIELPLGSLSILLAGTERPWLGIPPQFPPATETLVETTGLTKLKVVLSHSPDQLAWARRKGVDLLLAGHTHGGQVRFPLLGPVLCPSRHGIRYASGLFVSPPTVMHVSRGIAGTRPLRWNAPPEISKLTLVPCRPDLPVARVRLGQ